MSDEIIQREIKELIQYQERNHSMAWAMITIAAVFCVISGFIWGFGAFFAAVLCTLFGIFTGIFTAWFSVGADFAEAKQDNA